jgi:hypothetical protein
VPDVRGKFRQEAELPLLPGAPWLRHPVQRKRQWFVICLDVELATLQQKPEVSHGQVHR